MATKRHKVFTSYHHSNDQNYRNRFEELFGIQNDIFISQSVQIGEIDPYAPTERIRQIIRDEYLRDTSVTVVLIGNETWKRKHVDWEIGASIRNTMYNPRSGLLGIFLPTYPIQWDNNRKMWLFNEYTIPPRLYDNWRCGYAKLYCWSENPNEVQEWIHSSFNSRFSINPDNSYPSFQNNRSGERWY